MPRPTYFLRVYELIVFPIAARPGQYIAVQPGHPTHTLMVLDESGTKVLRHEAYSDGAIYGVVLSLDPDAPDGKARFLTPRDRLFALLAA